jgi:segregation and condensation protein A
MYTATITDIPIDELSREDWEATLDRFTADMDPWDIDISELALRYRRHIAALQELRLEIPGRMLFTCSVLLRMKSDVLLQQGEVKGRGELMEELEDAFEAEPWWDEPDEPEEFSLPLYRCPRRRVTLNDLRRAFLAAMRVKKRKARRLISYIQGAEDEVFGHFQIGGADIYDQLNSLLVKIKELLAGRKVLSFFRLLERGNKQERISKFIEVLHLTARGDITCQQEEFLGDILIRLEQG